MSCICPVLLPVLPAEPSPARVHSAEQNDKKEESEEEENRHLVAAPLGTLHDCFAPVRRRLYRKAFAELLGSGHEDEGGQWQQKIIIVREFVAGF